MALVAQDAPPRHASKNPLIDVSNLLRAPSVAPPLPVDELQQLVRLAQERQPAHELLCLSVHTVRRRSETSA
jgi:hypothetical protein